MATASGLEWYESDLLGNGLAALVEPLHGCALVVMLGWIRWLPLKHGTYDSEAAGEEQSFQSLSRPPGARACSRGSSCVRRVY